MKHIEHNKHPRGKNHEKIIFYIIFFCITAVHANEKIMTHYADNNLRLRYGDNLSSPTITVLPQYTALRVIETGKTEEIDGVAAPWTKIVTQTGYTGWCFSAYVKEIESNIAEDIAISFVKRSSGSFSGKHDSSDKKEDVSSIDKIKSATGYYIQQAGRRFQGQGHAPEILTLTVEDDDKVYIQEIDIINNKTITLNKIQLKFNGKTCINNKTKLEMQNGKIQIIYSENVSKESWPGKWDYEIPYTFTGSLNSPIPDEVHRLTTDYLKTFAGRYVFDSYKIIKSENKTINIENIKKAFIKIDYNQKKKCLTIPLHDLYNFFGGSEAKNWPVNFVETTTEEPFWWIYSETAGFMEERFYFYKNGIAYNYEESSLHEDKSEYIKYVVFLKKDN